jgi:hypothetical protein
LIDKISDQIMAQWERRDKARQELQSIFEKRDEEKK